MEKGSKLDTTKNWLQLMLTAFGVISILYTVFNYIYGTVNSFVTEPRLQQHNIDDKSHPLIKQEVKDCEAKLDVLSKHIEELHEAEVDLGAQLVRITAADLETNKDLKMAAANYYEQEFRRLIKKGSAVNEARLDALRQPFYSRPRIR